MVKFSSNIVIGATGTVKGDIEFGNNLRTENGADIDGYIKKTNTSKSKLTGDFLFKKKDKKEASEIEERPEVVNKEAIA
jgi:cytoskeletal protein CcmA (bactofilin family)